MRFKIEHEIPGRVRVNLHGVIPDHDAQALTEIMSQEQGVTRCEVYPSTGCMTLRYTPEKGQREAVLDRLCALDYQTVANYQINVAATKHQAFDFADDIVMLVGQRLLKRFILPKPIAIAWTVFDSLRFFWKGIKSLLQGRVDTPVLDAAAVAVSFLRHDYRTAGTTMFLLTLGDAMEALTRKRSEEALVDSLLDIPTKAWVVQDDGTEVEVDINQIDVGDRVRVRMGSRIPIDGTIVEGEAEVNQATLTGEPLAVTRAVGDDVFAGTVVEEGQIVIKTSVAPRETKLRQIGSLVEQSESLKSETEVRMTAMADKLVPWNFLLAAVVWIATRDIVKLSAALMVDYSCALKFAGSIASLTAMREGAQHGFTVKGASAFEQVRRADTLVFDKTGTLTSGVPRVSKIIALDGWDETEVLRLSACIEEHFPHPVARAVVNEAAARGIEHRERHAEVEYIVAHGIATSVDGKRVVIGSGHFIFEDEHVTPDARQDAQIIEAAGDGSPLWLAVDGKLAGVICIEDPLRPHIKEELESLRELGITKIVMLTGDNPKTAARIAAQAGITEFKANLLPEQKHEYLTRLRDEGHHVIMVGDGVNDSPALSLADVGVAMGDGAAIAREVADVTLSGSDFEALVRLRRLSQAYSARLNRSFRIIIGLNSTLLALGIAGVIAPTVSSLLHNGSTVLLSLSNSRTYLKEDKADDANKRV